jgi:hypothetical protein
VQEEEWWAIAGNERVDLDAVAREAVALEAFDDAGGHGVLSSVAGRTLAGGV